MTRRSSPVSRSPSLRGPLRPAALLAAIAASFALGFVAQRWPLGVRDAHAQPAPAIAATLYVPADGLLFRSIDGRPIARLSRDPGGGVFELYDARGEVAQRVSAGTSATWGAVPGSTSPRELHPNPYTTDSDPFEARSVAPASERPGPGF